MEYHFITKACNVLTDSEFEQCADLFSTHYGKYSGMGGKVKGQQIKMSTSLYKRFYKERDDMFVSLCFDKQTLLGQAFFLRKSIPGKGICTWVTQLVVHNKYRNRKIGSKLLHSAWGFSDYYAWGLATANAITLKTLESATWREINIEDISRNIEVLEQLVDDIPFAEKENIRLSPQTSQIFTNFYPEFEPSNNESGLGVYAKKLGEIQSGNEWLAFTFASQEMTFTETRLKKFLDFSEQQLKEAYSRMDMPAQGWTKGTQNEIDYILSKVPIKKDGHILDLGCGQGRHSIELAKRGYENIVGLDFSESNIRKAQDYIVQNNIKASFICSDIRQLKLGAKYDLVLCLYDVIGSFKDDKDNERILKVIKRHLNEGGIAVVSVMNMELTDSIAIHKVSLNNNPKELLKLAPSNTMAVSGNVFRPDYYLINTDDNLVYRKEQFESDGMLSAEYVVVDKRYRMDEFVQLAERAGLKIVHKQYVQAGKWDIPLNATDIKAKEILFFLSL